MASPFRPYQRLITLHILDQPFSVPENNSVLRCLQFLASDEIASGPFCWNEDCQRCRITCEEPAGTSRTFLSCRVLAADQMRIRSLSPELRWCLRALLKSHP